MRRKWLILTTGLIPTLTLIALGTMGLLGTDLYVDRAVERSAEKMAQHLVPSLRALESVDQSVAGLALAGTAVAGRLEPPTQAQVELDAASRGLEAQLVAYEPFAELPEHSGQWREVQGAIEAFRLGVLSNLRHERPQAFEMALKGLLSNTFFSIRRSAAAKNAEAVDALKDIARTQRREVPSLVLVMSIIALGALLSIELSRRRGRLEGERERALMARLEQTNANLDAFAGLIAHDLRNPLAPILTGSQLIERAEVPDDVRGLAARIDRSAQRLGRMIDGLLAFARTGAEPLGPLCTPAEEAIEEVLASLRERATELDAHIELRIAPGCSVRCERELFASVMQNLIENALKYGLHENAERRIEIRCQPVGAEVLLAVEDHGPGVPPAVAARIFEPLFQAAGAKEGLGLGLATARRLVEARGGRIELAPKAARGSCFQVWLPAATLAE